MPSNVSKKNRNQYSQVRTDHATELAEDYVEAISDLIDSNGQCRAVDLAKRFNVTPVTVNRTLSRLVRDGWVVTEPYRPVQLTTAGRQLARQSRERHQIVHDFLIALGVDEDTARIDSEGIEHHVSPKTLRAMQNFVEQPSRA